MQDDLAPLRQEVGHQRRQADAEVDVGALGDVARHARRHLLAVEFFHQAAFLSVAATFTTRLTKIPGVTTTSGSMLAQLDGLAHLHHGALRRRRHDRREVARAHAVGEVAPAVGAVGLDQRVVGVDRILEHVVAIADAPRLLALGELGAVGGRREERADAGARGADALGERALRHQLELELARAVRLVEVPRVGLARKRAQDLAHALRADQRGEAGVGVAGVVVDDGEVARALRDQRVDQRRRHAGVAEAVNHDGGAVGDVGEGGFGAGDEFVDHRGGNYGIAAIVPKVFRTHFQYENVTH